MALTLRVLLGTDDPVPSISTRGYVSPSPVTLIHVIIHRNYLTIQQRFVFFKQKLKEGIERKESKTRESCSESVTRL